MNENAVDQDKSETEPFRWRGRLESLLEFDWNSEMEIGSAESMIDGKLSDISMAEGSDSLRKVATESMADSDSSEDVADVDIYGRRRELSPLSSDNLDSKDFAGYEMRESSEPAPENCNSDCTLLCGFVDQNQRTRQPESDGLDNKGVANFEKSGNRRQRSDSPCSEDFAKYEL